MRRCITLSFLYLLGAHVFPSPALALTSAYVPNSIVHDCSADAQPALQAWLATVPDGAVIRFPAMSDLCYRLDRSLLFSGRNDLSVEAGMTPAGSRFIPTLRAGVALPDCSGNSNIRVPVVVVKFSMNVDFKFLAIAGTNASPGHYSATYYCQHGISILSSSGSDLSDLTITNPWGDCQYAGTVYPEPVGATNVTVSRLVCSGAGREGAGLVRGHDISVTESSFTNIGHWGFSFDLNIAADYGYNITFSRNYTEDAKLGTVNASARDSSTRMTGVTIEDNTCGTCIFYVNGSLSQHATGISIARNTASTWYGTPDYVRLRQVDGVVVDSNTMPCQPPPNGGRAFASLGNTDSVSITNNVILGCIVWLDNGGNTNTIVYGNQR